MFSAACPLFFSSLLPAVSEAATSSARVARSGDTWGWECSLENLGLGISFANLGLGVLYCLKKELVACVRNLENNCKKATSNRPKLERFLEFWRGTTRFLRTFLQVIACRSPILSHDGA